MVRISIKIFTVLVLFATMQVQAETIKCIDSDNKPHTVKFIEDNIDFTYVDGVQYEYAGEDKASSTVFYKSHNKEVIFYVDDKNRDWFHLLQATVNTKKDEKYVDFFFAKCDNVNVLK